MIASSRLRRHAADFSHRPKRELWAVPDFIFRPDWLRRYCPWRQYDAVRSFCGSLAHDRFVPIVLQKSKIAGQRIFRENTRREAITDSYDFNGTTEVACEFNVRR